MFFTKFDVENLKSGNKYTVPVISFYFEQFKEKNPEFFRDGFETVMNNGQLLCRTDRPELAKLLLTTCGNPQAPVFGLN